MKKPINLLLLAMAVLPYIVNAEPMRDPTQPPGGSTIQEGDISNRPLDLTAIFVYPDVSIAIIGGQVVKSGDHLGEFVVTTINKDTVVLTGSDNKHEELRLITPVSDGLTIKGH